LCTVWLISTTKTYSEKSFPLLALNRRTSKMTVKKDAFFFSFCRFNWYGYTIVVWPIAALPDDLSANQKGVFSVTVMRRRGLNINR
jgi:hypothetical protein